MSTRINRILLDHPFNEYMHCIFCINRNFRLNLSNISIHLLKRILLRIVNCFIIRLRFIHIIRLIIQFIVIFLFIFLMIVRIIIIFNNILQIIIDIINEIFNHICCFHFISLIRLSKIFIFIIISSFKIPVNKIIAYINILIIICTLILKAIYSNNIIFAINPINNFRVPHPMNTNIFM